MPSKVMKPPRAYLGNWTTRPRTPTRSWRGAQSQETNQGMTMTTKAKMRYTTCKWPGCERRTRVDPSGARSLYCPKHHKEHGAKNMAAFRADMARRASNPAAWDAEMATCVCGDRSKPGITHTTGMCYKTPAPIVAPSIERREGALGLGVIPNLGVADAIAGRLNRFGDHGRDEGNYAHSVAEADRVYYYYVKHGRLDAVMLAEAKRQLRFMEEEIPQRGLGEDRRRRLHESMADLRRLISNQGGWR